MNEEEITTARQVQVSERPLFDELLPMFKKMHQAELTKAADWMVTFASDRALSDEQEQRECDRRCNQEPVNDYERCKGVVTYRGQV